MNNLKYIKPPTASEYYTGNRTLAADAAALALKSLHRYNHKDKGFTEMMKALTDEEIEAKLAAHIDQIAQRIHNTAFIMILDEISEHTLPDEEETK